MIELPQRKHINLRLDSNQSDLEAFNILRDIQNNIVNFINNGKNLYIHSSIAGNGKSSWALRLVQSYFNKIWSKSDLNCRALFINVPRFLLALKDNITEKSSYVEHIKNNIFNCDVVIWDDIATKSVTVFESENLLSMIEYRISSGKSNIFTSNLNNNELHQFLGDRLYSRVYNYSECINIVGKDKRGVHND